MRCTRGRPAQPLAALLAVLLAGACVPAAAPTAAPTPAVSSAAPAPPAPTTPGPSSSPGAAGSPSFAASPTAAPPSAPSTPQASAAPPGWNPPKLALAVVAQGLDSPLLVTNAGDGSGRLFVIEQGGRIRVIRDGVLEPNPYLDISARIAAGGERGLLGLAFARTFASDGRFYVDYTDHNGDTVVSELRAPSPAADVADPSSERILLHVAQPFPNHNGGGLAVATDGTLFVALGDGGDAGDPLGNGQRRDTLLGKLVRIDPRPTGGAAYGIPPDNPWPTDGAIRPEIWAYGLRNPWRFSFDRATGDLWIGDVGQGAWEEVDRVRAGAGGLPAGGLDFGWSTMEGSHCFKPAEGCSRDGLTLPVAEYDHGGNRCAVTGGYVARGAGVPGLAGTYVYGDYCAGTIWGLEAAAATPAPRVLAESGLSIASFGEDEAGELYVADLAGGTVSRLVAAP